MVGAGTDKTKAQARGGPAVVLVRPQLAVNIGMCARAMANFGLDDLRLVNPREGWPRSGEYREVAYSAAAGAAHLLDAARVLSASRRPSRTSTTSMLRRARERGQMKAVLTPQRRNGGGRVVPSERRGILFGPERTGLDNDEVAIADFDHHLPVEPRLCLAQSRAGGAAVRLRVVQGGAWRRAAAIDDPAPNIAASAARDGSSVLRLSRGEARRERLLPAGRRRSRACGAICATSFTAWN